VVPIYTRQNTHLVFMGSAGTLCRHSKKLTSSIKRDISYLLMCYIHSLILLLIISRSTFLLKVIMCMRLLMEVRPMFDAASHSWNFSPGLLSVSIQECVSGNRPELDNCFLVSKQHDQE
jgi:hypothetical protein